MCFDDLILVYVIVLGFEYNYGDTVYVMQIIYWHEGKMILGVEDSASSVKVVLFGSLVIVFTIHKGREQGILIATSCNQGRGPWRLRRVMALRWVGHHALAPPRRHATTSCRRAAALLRNLTSSTVHAAAPHSGLGR